MAVQTGDRRDVDNLEFTPAVVDGMLALAEQQRVPPVSVVMTALAVVLARYCRRRELSFGVAVPSAPFASVRVNITGEDTCSDVVRTVGKELQQSFPAQVATSGGFATDPDTEFDAVVAVGPWPLDRVPDLADVLLVAEDRPQGCTLLSRHDRTDPTATEALSRELAAVLDRITRTPDRRLDDICIISDVDTARLADWNDTGTPVEGQMVPHAVVRQATAAPTATAVVAADGELSYGRLVGRAAQLAWHLRSLGIGTEDVVGIVAPRTTDLPVALLGTQLAGAAYLPLDTAYPADRLRFMLEDAGVRVVVTLGNLADSIAGDSCRHVRLDLDAEALDGLPTVPPEVDLPPTSAAYVMYTSGSSGVPKGVVVEHRNVAAFVDWATRTYAAAELALVAAPTSMSFDLSVYELFVTLASGGTVLLLGDALELAADGRTARPTLVNSVPSAMEALTRVGHLPSSVGIVNVCGEPLSPSLLGDLVASEHPVRVCNLYGPTEATVYATSAWFDRDSMAAAGKDEAPTIGRPIIGTKVWVLDDFGHPVPPGVAGELYIGGHGVARGYAGRPALTAERFVPDPFGGEQGARLYRTGDVVRWRDDGQLDFLGRRDHQVKVRGFRIELPEVEVTLHRHPNVREAVVVVSGTSVADRSLVAYIVSDGSRDIADVVERFVADRLPPYMVPQRIVILDALPRLPNGKVDRKALVEARSDIHSSVTVRGPQTDTERALADIWSSVLGVDAVGVDDDFFRLGGQSLLAMQVVARVEDELGVRLPLQVLFEKRSLSAVAASLDTSRLRGRRSKPVVRRNRSRGRLDASQLQVVANDNPAVPPTMAITIRLAGALDVPALEGALNQLVHRHESLRTVFRKSWRGYRQIVLPWHDASLAPVDGKRRPSLDPVLSDPYDLANGPLVRWQLVRRSRTDHLLNVGVHEVAADGWSAPILLSELATLYGDLHQGRPPSLPEPALQYLDVAHWRRRTQGRRVRSREARYWRERLRHTPVAFDLMPDRWPVHDTVAEPCTEHLVLDRAFTERLRTMAEAEGVTLYMVLFAAFQALLCRWTGQPTAVLRSTLANRTLSELEPVVGFFVNHVLMPTDVSDNPTFRDLLTRVRDDQLEGMGYTAVPYHRTTARATAMRTARTHWPSGRLRFQFLNYPHGSRVDFPGLEVREEPLPRAFDEHFGMLGFEQLDRSVAFVLAYDGAWFQRTTVTRLLSEYEAVLDAVATTPAARIDELPAMDRRRTDAVLRAGRGPTQSVAFRPVHKQIAEQAERTPTATAVVCGSDELSYAELDRRAEAVAEHLMERGARSETPVVVVATGVEGVAASLGVLRAGAMCIPVDPTLGRPAVERIAAHAGATVVLTHDGFDAVRPGRGASKPTVEAEAAAFALYCSSPDAPPRATVLTHEGVAHAVAWQRTAIGLRRGDRWAMLLAGRLGRAVWTIWPALAAGATVVLAGEEALADPGAWVAEGRISVCTVDAGLVPTVLSTATTRKGPLRLLLTDEPVSAPEGRIPVQIVEQLALPEAALPPLSTRTMRTPSSPAFSGTATAGVHALVLDPWMNPLPPNAPGELFVDASHLARGYLGDPRATALHFLPDPFADRPGARMFRTGITARVGAKDRIDVLGRRGVDETMRGLPVARYALPIEASLLAHPDVEAVVATVVRAVGEPRLALYVQTRRGSRLRRRELLALLPPDLPGPAQPIFVELVDAMPRTLDGSVDVPAMTHSGKRRT